MFARIGDIVAFKMSFQHEDITTARRHSKLGIASTITGAAIPVLLILFFAALLLMDVKKNSPGSYVAGAGLIFAVIAPVLHLVGALLGIGGFFTKTTKKTFPVIGTVLNILLGISGVLLWILVLGNFRYGFR